MPDCNWTYKHHIAILAAIGLTRQDWRSQLPLTEDLASMVSILELWRHPAIDREWSLSAVGTTSKVFRATVKDGKRIGRSINQSRMTYDPAAALAWAMWDAIVTPEKMLALGMEDVPS